MNIRVFFESVCGPVRWRGDEGSAHCPLPGHGGRDKHPSFSVNAANGTFYCHKEHIGGGLKKLAELTGTCLPEGERTSGRSDDRRIVAAYDYTDAEGRLLYQTVRFSPKGFAQRRPDPAEPGDWIWNLNGVTPVPYRLPELLKALAAFEQVFVVEGEKDADRLAAWGLCATTNHGGAKKWRPELTAIFPPGAKVVLLPDNDSVGRRHMRLVAASLHRRSCDVMLIDLPELPEKGDVSDWIAAGHTKEELLALLATAEQREFPLTDLGNAERLASRHGGELKYCGAWGTWLHWDGCRWRRDQTGEAWRRAAETVRDIQTRASRCGNVKRRAELQRFGVKCEAEGRLRSLLKLGQSQPDLCLGPEVFDRDGWALNVANGTIDLRSGVLLAAAPERLLTKLAPVAFDPAAQYPTWEAFLRRVFAGQQDLIDYVQKAAGYCLTGDCREQCLFLLYGLGANGKSTFLSTLMTLCGDYARQLPMESLLARRDSAIPNDIAALRGARLVAATESEAGQRLAESKIKQMTGQDRLAARFMRGEWFEFEPEFKLWIATNHKPAMRGCDEAIWRRIRLIPFTVTIPVAERDPELPARLRAELPGILRWAVDGCRRWQAEGLSSPPGVATATDAYREEMDAVGEFIRQCCGLNPLAAATVAETYRRYEAWCAASAEHALSKRTFDGLMREHGLQTKRGTGNVLQWAGLGLNQAALTA